MTDKSETISIAQNSAAQSVQIDCNFPGGNVRIFDIDNASGIVQLDSDFRDSVSDQFWTYFRVRGAAGKKLTFILPAKALSTEPGFHAPAWHIRSMKVKAGAGHRRKRIIKSVSGFHSIFRPMPIQCVLLQLYPILKRI